MAPNPTPPRDFASAALLRLASRVLDGDVVFFIGSGFSIDSEHNTAPRMLCRLLLRLVAMSGIRTAPFSRAVTQL